MCHHTSHPKKEILNSFSKSNRYSLKGVLASYYHVSAFDRPFLPVTLNSEPKLIQAARWKLLPAWIETEDDANASVSTCSVDSSKIFEKINYSPFILKNRGLLWVDGFFESHKMNGQKHSENFYIHKPGREIFSLGIVWTPWTDSESGVHYNTFAVITVPDTPMMAVIHNEKKLMPLIIDAHERERWLMEANTRQQLLEFFNQEYAGDLHGYRIKYSLASTRRMDTNLPEIQDRANSQALQNIRPDISL